MMTALHVFFGTVALVVAPAAVFARKGGSWHRRCGFAFMLAMAIVLFSAGFLWQAKGHMFLLPLAAVSGYLIFNGYRAVARNRRRTSDPFEDRVDMLAAGIAVLAALGIVYLAATASTPVLMPTSSSSGNSVTINTTTANTWTCGATWGTSNTSNTITCYFFQLELLT